MIGVPPRGVVRHWLWVTISDTADSLKEAGLWLLLLASLGLATGGAYLLLHSFGDW